MIREFVAAWDKNKQNLRHYIASNRQGEYDSYGKLVKALFREVINPYLSEYNCDIFNTEKLHEIDDGDYQGSLIFLVPRDTYQPSPEDYVMTFQYYGSCSGCDTLLGISQYCDDKYPDKEQIDDYMTLCLHLLQHFRYAFANEEECDADDCETSPSIED